jgi:hypothetical protein
MKAVLAPRPSYRLANMADWRLPQNRNIASPAPARPCAGHAQTIPDKNVVSSEGRGIMN